MLARGATPQFVEATVPATCVPCPQASWPIWLNRQVAPVQSAPGGTRPFSSGALPPALQLGVARVDPRVDDGDDDAGAGLPGGLHGRRDARLVEVPGVRAVARR